MIFSRNNSQSPPGAMRAHLVPAGRLVNNRTRWRGGFALALVCAIASSGQGCGEGPAPAPLTGDARFEALSLDESARLLHREAIVIDTHSDTTPRFEDPSWRFDERHAPAQGHMDLPRMREGGLDVQFWSIYLGKPSAKGLAIQEALQRIDAVHRMVDRYPEQVALATTVEEVRFHAGQGKMVSLMGVEGGHIIEDDLAALRSFYRLGVRYMTLTHSFHTGWADSSGTREDLEPLHHGLTPFGEEVVIEMNRLGMMVDISHVADETFWDVLEVTRAPVIASHSSVRAVANHRRNIDDEMLRGLARNGGVVMINFYRHTSMRLQRSRRELISPAGRSICPPFVSAPPKTRRLDAGPIRRTLRSIPYPRFLSRYYSTTLITRFAWRDRTMWGSGQTGMASRVCRSAWKTSARCLI